MDYVFSTCAATNCILVRPGFFFGAALVGHGPCLLCGSFVVARSATALFLLITDVVLLATGYVVVADEGFHFEFLFWCVMFAC